MRLRQNRHLLHSNFLIVSDPSIHFSMLLESKSPVSKVATALETPGLLTQGTPSALSQHTCIIYLMCGGIMSNTYGLSYATISKWRIRV